MDFSVLLLNDARRRGALRPCLRFVRATLQAGHCIRQVFFFREAVRWGSELTDSGNAEDLRQLGALAQHHGFDLLVCNTALERRGLELPTDVTVPLRRGTLGQWVMAAATSRVIEFTD